MPDPTLHGNHRPCQPCGGSGRSYTEPGHDCAWCNGLGWMGLEGAEIVRRTVAEVKRLGYWRRFDERNGIG